MKEIHCIILGRVQMVMYRDFATRKARKLGINGWVKNLPDGSVNVVAQGTQESLEKFIACLHTGSVFARVDNVQVEWLPPGEPHSNFLIAW